MLEPIPTKLTPPRNPMVIATIDQRGLDSVLNSVRDALVGTGGDASNITKDESRLLALGIMNVAQPKDKKKTAARIDSSIRQRFANLNEQYFPTGKVDSDGIAWYRSDSRFLYGVSEDLDMRKSSADRLLDIYYQAKVVGGKTRLVKDFNPPRPSGQKKAILAKVLTSKASMNRLVAMAKLAIGKLPASWLATARQISPSANAPEWIARHLKGSKTTKSITDLTGLSNANNPSVTFGSSAKGVGRFGRSVQFAVNLRAKKLAYRLDLILSGYAEDVKNGIKAQRHANKVKGQP